MFIIGFLGTRLFIASRFALSQTIDLRGCWNHEINLILLFNELISCLFEKSKCYLLVLESCFVICYMQCATLNNLLIKYIACNNNWKFSLSITRPIKYQ